MKTFCNKRSKAFSSWVQNMSWQCSISWYGTGNEDGALLLVFLWSSQHLIKECLYGIDNMSSIHLEKSFNLCVSQLCQRTGESIACIDSQNGYVQVFNLVSNGLDIFIHSPDLWKISHDVHHLDLVVLLLYLDQLLLHFVFISRNHANIEPLSSKLVAHLQTYAIRATSNKSPAILWTVLLVNVVSWL